MRKIISTSNLLTKLLTNHKYTRNYYLIVTLTIVKLVVPKKCYYFRTSTKLWHLIYFNVY